MKLKARTKRTILSEVDKLMKVWRQHKRPLRSVRKKRFPTNK